MRFAATAALVVAISACTALAEQKPNIVIIVADDLGWADVSFHGQEIKTPNLDRLTNEGAELTRFYVCPVCSPTRASLMTGRYPIRYGLMRAVLPPWREGGLDLDEMTLPQVLAEAGYEHRGIFGKWHLGHSDVKYHPLRRGFTEFTGHYNGAIDYFTHEREGELDWHRDYASNYDQGYSTDLIARAAVDFIERHAAGDAPFLCYVPFNAPHSPLQAKQKDLDAYQHLAQVNPYPRKRKKPAKDFGMEGRGDSPRQTLAAMISSMDQGVGQILQALEDAGIADNTLVWFFSDNGGVGVGNNRPLRAGKATVFEGGIRVVAALRWPNKVQAGIKITSPASCIDVLPTLMQVTGVSNHGGKPLDGRSLVGMLVGRETAPGRDLYSYIGQGGENSEQITLIEPEWKLVVVGRKLTDPSPKASRKIYLFRIGDDPYEKTNVAQEHPEVVERMVEKLKVFRALQPADAVPPYGQRSGEFVAPKEWKIPGT